MIIDNGEPANLEYEHEMKDHFVKIIESKAKFRLMQGVYEFYLKNTEVKGEYGMAREKELYQVSKSEFFDPTFLNVTAVDQTLIQFYLKKWTPLFENGNDGLVRHSICGSENYTEIFERSGNYFWRDQGAMDGVEYTIVGFKEGEGDSMEARIKFNFGTSQRILVFSEAENLIFIDSKTYTNNPANYTIVDDDSNCAGE